MSSNCNRSRFQAGQTTLSILAMGITVVAVACGGMSSSIMTTPGTTAQTLTQVKIGDAPASRVIDFEVTISSISLTPSGGGSAIQILSSPRHLELTHLSATSELLSLLKVPQGTYSSASISVSNPEIVFINNVGAVQKIEQSFNQAVTVTFNPALSVGASSSIVSIDFNIANSLTFDALGNVTGVNVSGSSFTVSTAAVAAEDRQGHDDGELEDTTGVISAVNGSSFTLMVNQTGAALTFVTDANTRFEDGASLAVNKIVTVDGITKSDGTLYAKKIEGIEDEAGAEAEGLITAVSGNPATQLTFVADHGMGSGMDDTKVGNTFLADVSNADYRVKQGDVDTSGIGGLPSPPEFPFDAATIHAGQRIEIESRSAFNGSSISAHKVKLQQQALVGTVTGLSGTTTTGPATFTLTVASDSAFALLSGKTQLTVSWQPGTDLHNTTSVTNGQTVRVRGLVFFTGSNFNMIARRIDH